MCLSSNGIGENCLYVKEKMVSPKCTDDGDTGAHLGCRTHWSHLWCWTHWGHLWCWTHWGHLWCSTHWRHLWCCALQYTGHTGVTCDTTRLGTPMLPAQGKLKQESRELEASLGHIRQALLPNQQQNGVTCSNPSPNNESQEVLENGLQCVVS